MRRNAQYEWKFNIRNTYITRNGQRDYGDP